MPVERIAGIDFPVNDKIIGGQTFRELCFAGKKKRRILKNEKVKGINKISFLWNMA